MFCQFRLPSTMILVIVSFHISNGYYQYIFVCYTAFNQVLNNGNKMRDTWLTFVHLSLSCT